MPDPRASIILPTLEGAAHLARLLPNLAAQELSGGLEILAIDSTSRDATRDLLAAAGARVECIERADFGHGRTRNRAARDARGEFLVFLSQDALPDGTDWLARLLSAFDDPRVAGAYSRVLPHPEDDPLTARTVLSLPEASEEERLQSLDGRSPESLTAYERCELQRFNDVASAIRRSVFTELPFPDVSFGEDVAWAGLALAAGHALRFVPQAVVRHAHRYTARQAFERYRIDAAFQLRLFGLRARPGLGSVLRGILYELREDLRFSLGNRERGGAWHLLRAPLLRSAQVLGQYRGSRGPGSEPAAGARGAPA